MHHLITIGANINMHKILIFKNTNLHVHHIKPIGKLIKYSMI